MNAAEIIIIAFVLIVLFASVVFLIQFFIPIAVNLNMNTDCRNAMLLMENNCGLSSIDINNLKDKLTARGLTNITIEAPTDAKQGDEITLDVEADYVYMKKFSLFVNSNVTQHMTFNKTTMARKVIN
jgi:hypothetical protein